MFWATGRLGTCRDWEVDVFQAEPACTLTASPMLHRPHFEAPASHGCCVARSKGHMPCELAELPQSTEQRPGTSCHLFQVFCHGPQLKSCPRAPGDKGLLQLLWA